MNHLVKSLMLKPRRGWGWGPEWVLICACGHKITDPDPLVCNRCHEIHTMETFK